MAVRSSFLNLAVSIPVARKNNSLVASAWWVIALIGGAMCLICLLGGRFQASRSVFLTAITGMLTGAAATVLRSLSGRTRPDAHELQGFYGIWHNSHWIIGRYEFGAFPSGHAATVIGLATAAWLSTVGWEL